MRTHCSCNPYSASSQLNKASVNHVSNFINCGIYIFCSWMAHQCPTTLNRVTLISNSSDLRWVWISSATTKRRSSMGIFGDETVEAVAQGNLVAARFALLALVCTVFNIFWCAAGTDNVVTLCLIKNKFVYTVRYQKLLTQHGMVSGLQNHHRAIPAS